MAALPTVSPPDGSRPSPGLDPWTPRRRNGANLPHKSQPGRGEQSVPGWFFSCARATSTAEAPLGDARAPAFSNRHGRHLPQARLRNQRREQSGWVLVTYPAARALMPVSCHPHDTRRRRQKEPPAIAAGVAIHGWSAPLRAPETFPVPGLAKPSVSDSKDVSGCALRHTHVQRSRQGRLGSNVQPGTRYCIATESSRAPSPCSW